MAVNGTHVQRVAVNRQTAVDAAATDAGIGIRGVGIGPEHAAGARIKGDHIIRRADGIHDAINYQRSRFEFLPAAGGRARLPDPFDFEIGNVIAGNLAEVTVALAVVVTLVQHPVARFGLGIEQTLRSHLGLGGEGSAASGSKHGTDKERFHLAGSCTIFSDTR